ncbi:uncharacterized protein LOC6536392 isoform X2 [Drosophila yakuba]|uniref:Uncharacterized protein, isoform B n=1 Tax=Drosophila yakuba TaxID=7245 RepID=A0A0R1E6H0_DROYA|nr:uncharacterized protein LOC6536392 isoform X2 [Drosophila yakuba]KRK03298.1 uncharacterized protein Dyak_GE25968, isoform B [Drosophila yakuba]
MAASNGSKSPMEHDAAGCDEVDFIVATHNNNNDYEDLGSVSQAVINTKVAAATAAAATTAATTAAAAPAAAATCTAATPNNEPNSNTLKKAKERRTLFHFGSSSSKKLSQSKSQESQEAGSKDTPPATTPAPLPPVPIGTPPRQYKFVKSNSLARLLGNTYNAKKFEKQEQKRLASGSEGGKFNTYSGRRGRAGPYLERFKRVSKEDGDVAGEDDTVRVTNVITLTTDSRDLLYGSRQEHVGRTGGYDQNDQLTSKAYRTLTRSLGKLWRRTHSVDISTPDPEFKVSYLGNVLTGWAKGEGCVEKQLNTLWRNYTQHSKPDVIMRLKVCASGLKATTRQHGLTEYWAHRITYCCAPKNYPRVFCWIYRHEGRKLKHELRCHAVLCSKEKIAQDICDTLRENLESALREFKREKILKQNARLSLANAVYDNPSLPRRKIMLSVGGNNYRPPLERSKSAPKLMAIEEAIGEEEGDEIEDTNEPEMMPCCQKDSLYPAMTLGRRRCRRGHSIRRTGKIQASSPCCSSHMAKELPEEDTNQMAAASSPANDGSDSDDFEKLLKFDTTLSNELLPYFDMQLHKNSSQSMMSLSELKEEEGEPLSLLPTINSDPSADPEADYNAEDHDVSAPRRSGVCSDGEEDFLDDTDDHYFRHAAMLTMLHRSSMRKMRAADQGSLKYRHQTQSSISSNASSSTTASTSAAAGGGSAQQGLASPDSDEGSISSGCETASTVTNANHEEYNGKRDSDSGQLEQSPDLELEQAQVLEQMMIYQRLEQQLRNNSGDATNYSSSSSITLKRSNSGSDKQERSDHPDDDNSDSDESGYVEFQEKERPGQQPLISEASVTLAKIATVKPQIPPKPAPRRSLSLNAVATIGAPAGSSAGKASGTAV